MFRNPVKTGACHRFFCVYGCGLAWALNLWLLPLGAQIELPEGTGTETRRTSEESSAVEKAASEEVQRAIKELERRQGPGMTLDAHTPKSVTDDTRLTEKRILYELAPETLTVSCGLKGNQEIWGTVKNFSFHVKNDSGRFPVLLHQLVRAENKGEKWRFFFTGGDRLEGMPETQLLSLQLSDGVERHLNWSEIRLLRIQAK